jgi:predicted N-formylglutamate amidohydrolase
MAFETETRPENGSGPRMIQEPGNPPRAGLLGPGEPPPFEVINRAGRGKLLLVCDHASRRIPTELGDLGLDSLALGRHIACDIGAGDVTRILSAALDAPAVLAGYSRLVVDCNRKLHDPTAFLAVSDGEYVPGNHGINDREKQRRADACYHPYHAAITDQLAVFERRAVVPAFVAIHSFTRVFNRQRRPWEIGVLWDTDPRIPVPLMEKLSARGIVVGDNEPYSGRAPADFTIDHHAEDPGLPHVSIEIRQDLIDHPEGVQHWASVLGDVLGEILADQGLYCRLNDSGQP